MFDEHHPQIAFLDIRMPGRSGLEVAAEIGARCHVVFITAYDQYAVKAFEAGAVDYLLKPVETDRLVAMKERMERKLATPPIDLSALVAQLRSSVKGDSRAHEMGQGGGGQAGQAHPGRRRRCTSSRTPSTRASCSPAARR